MRFVATSVLIVGAFAMGYAVGRPGKPTQLLQIGEVGDDWRDKDAQEVSPAVRDAVGRWKAKTGENLRGRNVQIISLPDRMCIKLAFEDLSIGGEPVYCYKASIVEGLYRETTELVYDGSNVE
ncbi:hypothetical protein D2V17_05260 [Aurantiacibacter xanthus]|uniref:Uncharacterized protein n=1 Tax=Aurantiacibacter xanthus TaxID=1784712 RepID=A0A3A1P7T5_9SPHN|nr:hypothetical protein D2V17_05260 [Aurantiacibacter xanthus]